MDAMGITNLWNEFTPQESVSLAELSQGCFERKGRPLRLTVDIFPHLLVHKGATDLVRDSGGMNHAAKNMFYTALHFVEAGVQPIFVYDGPNKPALKRGNYSSYSASNPQDWHCLAVADSSTTRSIADKDRDQSVEHIVRLTKDLFDTLGLPWIDAVGEGEAACCALEKAGLVDGIVTTDGDAFVFGAKSILRLHNKVGKKIRRTEVYDSRHSALLSATGSELTQGFWLLFALISGGDYHNGVPGCGPDIARRLYDNFDNQLDRILDSESPYTLQQVVAWSRSLPAKLRLLADTWARTLATKLSGGFPESVVRFYLSPAVHDSSKLRKLVGPESWSRSVDIVELRRLSHKDFDWKGYDKACKFGNNVCPRLLAQYLMTSTQENSRQMLEKCQMQIGKRGQRQENKTFIHVFYHPERLLGISLSAEPVIEGYVDPHSFDPAITQSCSMPEWLVNYGVLHQYERWCMVTKAKIEPRKQAVTANICKASDRKAEVKPQKQAAATTRPESADNTKSKAPKQAGKRGLSESKELPSPKRPKVLLVVPDDLDWD